jgi:regulator of cell morphogenesis and NO signaling
MNLTTEKTIREIALEDPATVRVFEKLGIDYCCGGRRPLKDACLEAGVPVERALEMLNAASATPGELSEPSWNDTLLSALTAHIVERYHKTARQEILRIEPLLQKVVSRHGSAHAELPGINEIFGALAQELVTHMLKEEQVLFPYIERMEADMRDGRPLRSAFFGSIGRPIAVMTADHDDAGALLARMRKLSNEYAIPEGACPTYRALYDALEEFERDLHRHVHLENNILFPRALQLESRAGEAAGAAH